MHRIDAYQMIRRRTAEVGLKGKLAATHSGRPASPLTSRRRHARKRPGDGRARKPATTKLYDRTSDEITLDEVERITI